MNIFFAVNAFYPLSGYKITADPMVIDNGSEYSVVFSTNDEGNAYIEYTYEGEDYKIFDNVGGKLVRGRIHSIPVPYEHLRNNKYRLHRALNLQNRWGSYRWVSESHGNPEEVSTQKSRR